ncbi:LysM peptidoglycan-binding domain-containing protein [Hymenobacter sp. AT01-02]|uniref:LysM peptidoglycan-binding domain-containing protein n=1 Tax=Hymenobacter sp. AT01-02 TaxID=1571877 RepID=UPI0005F15E56|nr:LysM domain-containing protein [Hymenobacter sp. AT01-02]
MRAFSTFSLLAALSLCSFASRAQQVTLSPTLSDDSVRVMSGLVQTSVRQLRSIYYEPNDAKAIELIDAAVRDITPLNQRLRQYTADLNPEQQRVLTQRLRQQPWQIELQTLLRSPQYKGFNARAAKNPALKTAAERLQAAGFIGMPKAATAARTAPTPTVAAVSPATSARPTNNLVASPPTPATSLAAAKKHTVQKGETLFSIAKQYNVKPAQLQAWNAKPDNGVKIGEVLLVEAAQ